MREKLIKLLQNDNWTVTCDIDMNCYDCKYISVRDCGTAMIADYLIANGVTVRQKGEWIHDIYNSYGCSECGERETMSHRKPKKHCPNCGAKMDGDAW